MKRFYLSLLMALPLAAQPVFTDVFPPDEYAVRRARVMAKIGGGVAIIQGTTERPGEQPLRQANQFFYLSGVVEPRAILVIDGRTKRSRLFLNPRNERRETMMYGPGLYPGVEAEKATGIESVSVRSEFQTELEAIRDAGRAIYTPYRPEVLGCASASDPAALARNTKADPWDGRVSREEAFIQHLKTLAPQSKIDDLDPILDELRGTKSPREIAILREATRIAGLGIIEAMRDARPGMKEYELQADAEYVFKKYGAYGPAYFALIATGENTWYSHYHKNTRTLDAGDLVQFDYAPDFKYYSSDVTRVFPANGKFTGRQREFYTIYLRLYQALMTSIEVHMRPSDVIKNAVVKMDAVMKSFKFSYSVRGTISKQPRELAGAQRRDGSARRAQSDADAGARAGLYHRTGDADCRRTRGNSPRRHDPDHGDGVRKPVVIRSGGDRRHRENDDPAWLERCAG